MVVLEKKINSNLKTSREREQTMKNKAKAPAERLRWEKIKQLESEQERWEKEDEARREPSGAFEPSKRRLQPVDEVGPVEVKEKLDLESETHAKQTIEKRSTARKRNAAMRKQEPAIEKQKDAARKMKALLEDPMVSKKEKEEQKDS